MRHAHRLETALRNAPRANSFENDVLSPHEARDMLRSVRAGLMTARAAAAFLRMTVDDVCVAVWGRVVM